MERHVFNCFFSLNWIRVYLCFRHPLERCVPDTFPHPTLFNQSTNPWLLTIVIGEATYAKKGGRASPSPPSVLPMARSPKTNTYSAPGTSSDQGRKLKVRAASTSQKRKRKNRRSYIHQKKPMRSKIKCVRGTDCSCPLCGGRAWAAPPLGQGSQPLPRVIRSR